MKIKIVKKLDVRAPAQCDKKPTIPRQEGIRQGRMPKPQPGKAETDARIGADAPRLPSMEAEPNVARVSSEMNSCSKPRKRLRNTKVSRLGRAVKRKFRKVAAAVLRGKSESAQVIPPGRGGTPCPPLLSHKGQERASRGYAAAHNATSSGSLSSINEYTRKCLNIFTHSKLFHEKTKK